MVVAGDGVGSDCVNMYDSRGHRGWGGLFQVKETDASLLACFLVFKASFFVVVLFKVGCLFGLSVRAWGESARTGTHLYNLLFRVQCQVEGVRPHQLL